MTKNKKLKREQEKTKNELERRKEANYKEHLIKMKELTKTDDTGRMPIHIFASHDDFVDDRMPISYSRQIEIAKSNQLLPKFKSLY